MQINTDISSIIQRSLISSSSNLEASFIKISAGKQTKAVEDAAKLMISQGMESQRRGSQEASQNAQAGMNMLQVADSGLGSINDNVQRIRELTVQRGNGTLNEGDIQAIDEQIGSLKNEIDRVSGSTKFNNVNLLDGSSTGIALQIGANSGADQNTVNAGNPLKSASSDDLGLSSQPTLDELDNALKTVNSRRSQIGALHSGLESTVNSLQTKQENLAASESTLVDTDIASEASKLTQNMVLQNASASLLAQANQSPAIASALI